MRIALTDYSSQEEVLRAIGDLPYEGGSRRIGDALQFLVDTVFSPAISRDHAPKVQYFNPGRAKACLSGHRDPAHFYGTQKLWVEFTNFKFWIKQK